MKTKEEHAKEVLFNAIHAYTGIPYEGISFDSRFVDDLGYDSLDSVETIIRLEDELNVEISDEVADSMKTVRDAYEIVITLPVLPTDPLPTSSCTFEGVLVKEEDESSECAEIECGKDITISINEFDTKRNDSTYPEILTNFQNRRVRITIEAIPIQ